MFRLAVEMLVVGLLMAAVGLALNPRTYTRPMAEGLVLVGAVAHLLLEVTGVNAWYAQNYLARHA